MNSETLNWIALGISLVTLVLNLYIYIHNKRIDKEIRRDMNG